MGSFSIWHWLVVLVIVAFIFGGRGKLSGIMGDAAKGIKAFREGLKDETAAEPEPEPEPKPLPKATTAARSRAKTKASN